MKNEALNQILNFLQNLEQEYQRAKAEKEQLESDVAKCKAQLDTAEKLIIGLGVEKESWKQRAS